VDEKFTVCPTLVALPEMMKSATGGAANTICAARTAATVKAAAARPSVRNPRREACGGSARAAYVFPGRGNWSEQKS
jgi:hypothetical protein